jgi:hypothetical protein
MSAELPAATPPSGAITHAWDDRFNADTTRLAYEHARETHRAVDSTADVLDRKVIAVFGVSSAIATLTPAVLPALEIGTLSWVLWFGACAAWLGCALQSWQAFKPRDYKTDPNPEDVAAPEWLTLGVGPYYFARLHYVAKTVKHNADVNKARAAALREAFGWALVEVGLLLVGLMARVVH